MQRVVPPSPLLTERCEQRPAPHFLEAADDRKIKQRKTVHTRHLCKTGIGPQHRSNFIRLPKHSRGENVL
jgi:hypothetical protein